MNAHELTSFCRRMAGLFPRMDWSTEEIDLLKRKVGHYPFNAAVDGLEAHRLKCNFNNPRTGELINCIEAERHRQDFRKSDSGKRIDTVQMIDDWFASVETAYTAMSEAEQKEVERDAFMAAPEVVQYGNGFYTPLDERQVMKESGMDRMWAAFIGREMERRQMIEPHPDRRLEAVWGDCRHRLGVRGRSVRLVVANTLFALRRDDRGDSR